MSGTALRQISAYCVTLICILGLATPARAQTLEADSLALVALYDSTGGPGWTNTWDLNTPVSSWHGVTVSGDRVIRLNLYNNNLSGPIPPEIGSLTSLTDLRLAGNQLTGPIPPEIGSLTSLQSLSLDNNQLTGPIPPEIGSLTSLTDLYLSNTQLTGPIPGEIGSLNGLTWLDLGSNQLTGPIPPEIGSLTSLMWLDLSGNQLTGPIPGEIGSLTGLTYLYLNNNKFTDLPDLNTLSQLGELFIENNRFTFEDIEPNVDVADYSFTYAPQDSVGVEQDTTVVLGASLTLSIAVGGTANQYQWLKDGTDISAATNDTLIIAPVSFADAGSYILRITNSIAPALTLYSRPVHVSVPMTPLQADSLALVALYDSTGGPGWNNTWDLSSPVSTWHGVTVSGDRVAWLYLSTNNLSGPIPPEIGSLTSLTDLHLGSNQLTGPIPPEIGNLTSLTYLALYCNQLSGPIPGEIGSLTSLTDLYLYNNQLTGPIPGKVGSLTALKNLELYNNQLTGPIPPEIGRLTSLRLLFLNNNKFTDLPNLNTLSALSHLRIHNNRFTFEDIEPNMWVASEIFTYTPQDSVGTEQDTTVYEGTSLTLSVAVGGTANQYQWLKDGTDIAGAMDDTLIIAPVSLAGAGSYILRITNTIATQLTLYSRPLHVTVIDTIPPTIPAGVVAVAGDSSVTLAWSPNSETDLSHYVVYQSTTAGFTPASADSAARADAPDTSVTLTGLANDTTYYFRVSAVDAVGNEGEYSAEVSATPVPLAVDSYVGVPGRFALHPNYPNPFNPSTTVRFDLPEATEVHLVVYDLMGREVVRLVNEHREAGYHRVVWDGRDARGREVPTGLYIARLLAPTYTRSIKLVLLK